MKRCSIGQSGGSCVLLDDGLDDRFDDWCSVNKLRNGSIVVLVLINDHWLFYNCGLRSVVCNFSQQWGSQKWSCGISGRKTSMDDSSLGAGQNAGGDKDLKIKLDELFGFKCKIIYGSLRA